MNKVRKEHKHIDSVSKGILYSFFLGALIFAVTGNSIYLSLIGPGAFLGLLFDLSAGRIQSKRPVVILIGLILGLLIGLIHFVATQHAFWFALAAPGAIFGLFFDPSIRAARQG